MLIVSAVGSAAFLLIISSERLSLSLIALCARFPLGDKIAPKLEQIYRAVARLMRPTPLALATVVSVAAWFCECLGFYIVLSGLADTTPALGVATFIYAFATIFGAVTMLPGGLGVTDGSLVGMAMQMGLTASKAAATAGAMLIRFCTLWFAVGVGLCALAVLRKTGSQVSETNLTA